LNNQIKSIWSNWSIRPGPISVPGSYFGARVMRKSFMDANIYMSRLLNKLSNSKTNNEN